MTSSNRASGDWPPCPRDPTAPRAERGRGGGSGGYQQGLPVEAGDRSAAVRTPWAAGRSRRGAGVLRRGPHRSAVPAAGPGDRGRAGNPAGHPAYGCTLHDVPDMPARPVHELVGLARQANIFAVATPPLLAITVLQVIGYVMSLALAVQVENAPGRHCWRPPLS